MSDISTGNIPAHFMREDAVATKPKNTLGKDDFLKLLMTQLRHQDPLKPMGHQEFATQLAQFGQLEQLTNIGDGISNLRTGMGEGAKLQALGMMGKRVFASTNEIDLVDGQSANLPQSTDPNLQPVKAIIFDAGGKPVREIGLAGKNNGERITWDGKNQEGIRMPSGKYQFRVHGVGKNGQAQEVGTELSGRVVGVDLLGEKPLLILDSSAGQTRLELSKVKKVEAAEEDVAKMTVKAPSQILQNRQAPVTNPESESAEEKTESGEITPMPRDRWQAMTAITPGRLSSAGGMGGGE